MLPKEKILANRLSIAMHDWPEESRANMIEWVTVALKEQREAGRQEERERCAAIVHQQQIAFCSDACGWALDHIKDGLPADAVRVAK